VIDNILRNVSIHRMIAMVNDSAGTAEKEEMPQNGRTGSHKF
jgi:hypothetical protein